MGARKKDRKRFRSHKFFNILMDRRREKNTDFLTISPTIPRSIKCNLSVLSSSYEIVDLLKKYESTRMFFEYYPHPYKNIQSLRFKIRKNDCNAVAVSASIYVTVFLVHPQKLFQIGLFKMFCSNISSEL